MRLLAVLAEHAHQTLTDDGTNARSEKKAFDIQVDQARNRPRGGIGMERGENKMPRQRGVNADTGCFPIAHFANHDHIRILSQE